jgi:hypothetical protein
VPKIAVLSEEVCEVGVTDAALWAGKAIRPRSSGHPEIDPLLAR